MNENETSTPELSSEPKKNNRGAVIVAVAMALGLFALIALNMK
jgi:uncharacterized protein involved in exopolysaccharide biosynthesis